MSADAIYGGDDLAFTETALLDPVTDMLTAGLDGEPQPGKPGTR